MKIRGGYVPTTQLGPPPQGDPLLAPVRRKRTNAKAKGTRNEHRSIALLEAAGYRCTRSAASLGEWDIVGISATDFVLVQTKSNAWSGSVEMEALTLFAVPPNCRKLVHRWRDGVRLPDVREVS